MTDTIRILPGQLSDSLALRSSSALADCTSIDSDNAGVFIAAKWPSLSTGEALLWLVLAWLNGGTDLPTAADLRAGLDAGNYKAAAAAISAGMGVTA